MIIVYNYITKESKHIIFGLKDDCVGPRYNRSRPSEVADPKRSSWPQKAMILRPILAPQKHSHKPLQVLSQFRQRRPEHVLISCRGTCCDAADPLGPK